MLLIHEYKRSRMQKRRAHMAKCKFSRAMQIVDAELEYGMENATKVAFAAFEVSKYQKFMYKDTISEDFKQAAELRLQRIDEMEQIQIQMESAKKEEELRPITYKI